MTTGTPNRPSLTPEQQQAARVDVTTWVSASAGTGKTHVLSARVLGLMVTGSPPENILCLTYTRAAAAEMANRIYDKLGDWAVEREDVLQSEIFRATGVKATEDQCRDARALFARVLEIPGGLKIQTIHSFCQTVLKRFPLEAALSPHFQVMDERTGSEFLKTAIDDIMQASAKIPSLARSFSDIAATSSEARFEKLVGAFIDKRGHLKRLLSAHGNNNGGEEGLTTAVYEALGVNPEDTPESIIAAAIAAPGFDQAAVGKMTAVMSEGSIAEKKTAARMAPFFAKPSGRQETFAAYMDAFFTGIGEPRKPVFVKATLEQHPEFEAIYMAEQNRLVKIRETLALWQVARNTEALICLSSAVLHAYTARKKAFGYLDYEDLVLVTDQLLRRPFVAQWILYKLDGRIDHILVDEAQDTNLVQWRLVEAIGEEFTSGRGAKDDLERTIFAVGDIKQSIYRFQGAEPDQFFEAKDRVKAKVLAAQKQFSGLSLDLSFRSTSAVLALVDAVITQPEARDGITREDEKIRHQAKREGHAGMVEIWPPEMPEQQEHPPQGWQLPLEQKFSSKPDARLAAKIARKIHSMVEDGDVLESQGRPIRFGDILVLLRSRSDFLGHLMRELKTLGVPVAGSDRMVLGEQLVIEDLLAVARFVLLPDDDYTLACVLKSPLVGMDEQTLFRLAHGRQGSLWRALKKDNKNKDIYIWLSGLLGRVDFVTPFAFFSGLLTQNNGRKKFIRRLGAEVNDPVDEFLNLTLEFERTHSPSLQGFLNWFEAAQTEVKRDLERAANEVRIMTIHGAKGLEAPVVFLPDTFHVPQKRGEELYELPSQDEPLLVWSARKELDVGPLKLARAAFEAGLSQENNRLLYVALTRAEDRLYISGWQNRKIRATTWYDIIRDAMEALPGVKTVSLGDGAEALRFESEQVIAPEDKGAEILSGDQAIKLPDWASRIPKAQEKQDAWIQPSRAGEGVNLETGTTGARARGVVIHKLLEILPDIAPAKRTKRAQSFMAAQGIPKDDQGNILASVLKVLAHPEFASLFGPGSLAEASLVGTIEGKKISGQVDRLVIKDNEILIIDYKSGPEDPKPSYLAQLKLYEQLLQGAYPGHRIRSSLLWTDTCKLITVGDTKMSKPAS